MVYFFIPTENSFVLYFYEILFINKKIKVSFSSLNFIYIDLKLCELFINIFQICL